MRDIAGDTDAFVSDAAFDAQGAVAGSRATHGRRIDRQLAIAARAARWQIVVFARLQWQDQRGRVSAMWAGKEHGGYSTMTARGVFSCGVRL